jgi:hypothetical protein
MWHCGSCTRPRNASLHWEAVPNICLQCCCGPLTSATPLTGLSRACVRRQAAHRDRYLPDRRAQQRRRDAPRDDAVGTPATAVLKSRCPTPGPVEPERNTYPRLLQEDYRTGGRCQRVWRSRTRPGCCGSAATTLPALRSNFDLPVHVHPTLGGRWPPLAAWQTGADAVDGIGGDGGTTSQPALGDRRRRGLHRVRHRAESGECVRPQPYWERCEGLRAVRIWNAPTGRVYTTKSRRTAVESAAASVLGLGTDSRISKACAGADRLLGRLIKVTPSSKVVGDLALHLVGAGVSVEEFAADPGRFDIPDSVIGFLRGDLGTPAGGWPEPLREQALAGRGTPQAVVEFCRRKPSAVTPSCASRR